MIFRWILSHSVIILVLAAILFAVWKVEDLRSWLPEVVTHDSADSHEAEVITDAAGEHQSETPQQAVKSKPDDTPQQQDDAEQAAADVSDEWDSAIQTQTGKGHESKEVSSAPQASEADEVNHDTGDTAQQAKPSGSGNNGAEAPVIASIKLQEENDSSGNVSVKEENTVRPQAGDNTEQRAPDNDQNEKMPAESASLNEQWLSARQAYWQQDLKQAEKQYLALREMSPEDPDIVGELGNLYYARGDLRQAVETYYETGLLLRDAGRVQEAWMLADDIQRLNAGMANELRNQLEENGSRF